MKYLKRQDGIAQVIIIVLAAVVIAAIGLAVWQSRRANTTSNTTTSSPSPKAAAQSSPSPTPTASASPATTPTPTVSDNDLILQAVRAYNSQSANDTATGVTIVGSNAKGNGATPGASSGYEFIAHKDNGTWKVVYRGQEQPGKALGTQYGLPTDWYSTAY